MKQKKHQTEITKVSPFSTRIKSCIRQFCLCRKRKNTKQTQEFPSSHHALRVSSVSCGYIDNRKNTIQKIIARVSPFSTRIKSCIRQFGLCRKRKNMKRKTTIRNSFPLLGLRASSVSCGYVENRDIARVSPISTRIKNCIRQFGLCR